MPNQACILLDVVNVHTHMTQATPTSPPILHNRYRIEAKLGIGRLAVVYRAFDERLHRAVLVHMLRRELMSQEPLRQRFIQEAHASARRSHQSLLEVYDSGEIAGRPYMITEYVTGRTLRELGALGLEEALLYFRQVVGAVAVCQAAGVPHPPISSNNLVIVSDGHVELLESWLISTNDVALDLVSYRAPERAEGNPITPASAVYALGLLLLEMLSGHRVVQGSDPRTIAQAHLTMTIPSLSQLRPSLHVPALEQVIRRATARRAEERYRDAADLSRALDDLWRALNSDTQRLGAPPVQRPNLRERINRTASEIVAPRPPVVVTPEPPPQEEQGPDVPPYIPPRPAVRTQSRQRSIVGLLIMMALFAGVSCTAYYIASLAVERLAIGSFRLPRPDVNLPVPSIDLPEWLTGVVGGSGEVYVVSGVADEGLNLRDQPSLSSQVTNLLPNGTLVRKLEGPQTVDAVPWLRVRARIDGQEVEGWVSLNFVKPVNPANDG